MEVEEVVMVEVVEAALALTAAFPSSGSLYEFERSEVRRAASSERRSSCGTWRRWLPPGRAGVPQIWPGPSAPYDQRLPADSSTQPPSGPPHTPPLSGTEAAAPRENPVCGVAGAAPAPSGDPPAAAPP